MPKYIERSGVTGAEAQHKWDDDDPGIFFLEDERLANRIAKASHRGVIALSAGFAEWIAWRSGKHCPEPVLLQEVEAVWAGIIDWRYVHPLGPAKAAPERKDWKGAGRGPVRSAFFLLSQIIALVKRGSYPAGASSALSKLALHIMPNPKPYKAWRQFAIERLASQYPFDPKEMQGPPVPREALDPDFDYKPEMARELLAKFLQGLNYMANPFLRSPEEMKSDGFEGIPYKY